MQMLNLLVQIAEKITVAILKVSFLALEMLAEGLWRAFKAVHGPPKKLPRKRRSR